MEWMIQIFDIFEICDLSDTELMLKKLFVPIMIRWLNFMTSYSINV